MRMGTQLASELGDQGKLNLVIIQLDATMNPRDNNVGDFIIGSILCSLKREISAAMHTYRISSKL